MPPPRTRTHDAVVHWVEAELVAGRLPIGSRLPAERALADRLGVSRASVREGLRILEAMGVVRTGRGSGPESGAIITGNASTGITAAFRLHLASRSLPVADLVETRRLLETWALAEAARRPGAEHLRHAGRLLHDMKAPGLTAEQFLLLDADFHVALVQAAGNQVVAAIMTSLRGAIHGYVVAAVPGVDDWPAMQRKLVRQHSAILAAVEGGEPERAARLVGAHITGFYRAAFPSGPD